MSIGTDLLYGYQPVSAALDAAMQEVEDIYRDRPAAVVATLNSHAERDPVTVFVEK